GQLAATHVRHLPRRHGPDHRAHRALAEPAVARQPVAPGRLPQPLPHERLHRGGRRAVGPGRPAHRPVPPAGPVLAAAIVIGFAAMTLSYAHGASPVPLLGETIGANFERTVAQFPDTEALVSRHQGQRFTYAALNEAIDVLARGLLGLGLEPGDRVGMWSPNNVEWVLVQYATAKVGVVLVNINPAYRTNELEYALKQSGCRLLISAPEFKTSDYRAMVAEVQPSVPTLERIIF